MLSGTRNGHAVQQFKEIKIQIPQKLIRRALFIWKLEESFGLVTKLSAKFDEMRMKSKNAFNSMYKDVGKFNGALKDTHNQITFFHAKQFVHKHHMTA